MPYKAINGIRMGAIEAGVMLALFAFVFLVMKVVRSRPSRPEWITWLLESNLRGVVFVTAVALIARALLLPFIGVPEPHINNEYSYLLMADTFVHGRLTNPTPPAWQHFETFHVNVRPSYHSIYPIGPGLVLALGQIVFHQPWLGIYLSTALSCGAICWALQAFVPPAWALIGGLLAVARIAIFGYWMNSYFGGALAALGGALALGAVVRLFDREQSPAERITLSCVFSVALLILATSRPYEGFAFAIPLLIYFAYQVVKEGISPVQLRTVALPVIAIGTLGVVMIGYYNHQTTGNDLRMPYVLNHHTYWTLPFFMWDKGNPSLALNDPMFTQFMNITKKEFQLGEANSFPGFAAVQAGRLFKNWFFYIGVALTLPLLIGLLSSFYFKQKMQIALWAAAFMAGACVLCHYNLLHYAAPATVVVYLLATEGLRYLWAQRGTGEQAFVIAICAAVIVTALTRQTSSSTMLAEFQLPDIRKDVIQQLEGRPGKHMVVVSYDQDRHYAPNDIVHNGADFDSQRILWARSKGSDNDQDLCDAYGDRNFWSVTTDDLNFILKPLALCGEGYKQTRFIRGNHD